MVRKEGYQNKRGKVMRNKTSLIIFIMILWPLLLPKYLQAEELSCSISINDGATYTKSRSVTLNLSASGGEGNKSMRFNNDGGSWSDWESFSTSESWTLNDSDGTRTVYFEVKDSSPTPNVDSDSDSIILDRINPVTFVDYDEGKGDNGWYIYVDVTLDPYDTTSGVNYTKYKVDGTWNTHYGESDFSFFLPDGASQQAEFYSVDNAGNQESHRYTDTKNVDGTEPVTTIFLSGTAGDNGWYTSNVTVSLSASDATSRVKWIKYKIGFFGEEMTYGDAFTLSDEGETTVYYWAKDIAGNEEWPKNSVDIKIDTTEPNTPVIDKEKIDDYTRGDSITIFWSSVFDFISDDVRYFVQCDDNKDFSSPYAQSGWITGTSYTFYGLEDETKYWYRVKAKDGAGNESGWSDKVFSIQDATDPEITIESPEDGFSSDEYKVSIVTVTLSDNLWCYRLSGDVNGDPTKVKPWASPDSIITSTYVVVNLEIQEGMNDITLIVEDRAGNSASKTIRVTYGIYIKDNFKFHYTTSPRYPIKVKYWTYIYGILTEIDYVGRDDHVDNTDRDGNRIPDYVDDYSENSFASIFNHVWNFETGFMGRQPISGYYDYSTGGIMNSPPGSKYNIYIINVGANSIYGFARPLPSSGASYIAVDNDYAGFSGSQSDNMKVTAAHEFFHAIQFTIDVNEDHWWMEATAVWMEDYVYDNINDYLQYLRDWFDSPEDSLDVFDGWHEYGSVIFAKYLSENYREKIIKDIWNGCAGSTQSLDAIQNALTAGGGLADNFKTFTYWNYDKEKKYDEGSLYAPYPTKIEFSHYNYPITWPGSINHLASNYIEFLPDPMIPTDATTTQNLHIEISTTTALWGGKVLKVDRAGKVVDVVNLASGDKMDIKGLGSNSTDKYSKIILVLSNTNTGGSAEPYTYDAFTSAVKYDSDRVMDPLRSGTSPKIYAKMVQDGLYSSESGESYSEDLEDVDDWFGNDDGNIDAGESPNIKVTLKNLGSVEIVDAVAVISPDSESSKYINFGAHNEDYYPEMASYGGTAEGLGGYWANVIPDTPLGQDLHFTLDIIDQYDINYDDKFIINDVGLDIHLRSTACFTNDGNNVKNGEWGNNNGNADAGELLAVPISLFNDGYSNIRRDGYYQNTGLHYHDKYNHYLVATLSTMDSYVKRIFDDSEKFEDILSRGLGMTLDNYNFLIRSSAPPDYSIPFTLRIRDVVTDVDGNSHIYDWEDQFDVAVTGGDTVPPLIGKIDIVNVPDVPILKEGEKVKFTTDILDGSDKVSRRVDVLYPDNSIHTIDVDKNSPVWNGYYERIIDYWQLPLSTGTLQDGTYTIQSLEADDGYGNVSSTETNKNIEIDTELPIAELPELENKYIHGVVNIIGTAKDVHLDTYKLYYAIGKNVNPDENALWTMLIESINTVDNDILYVWDTVGFEEGDYTLKLVVEDKVGHISYVTLNVVVDNTPPEISDVYVSPSFFSPTNQDGVMDTATLYGNAYDNLSPEIKFKVSLEDDDGFLIRIFTETTYPIFQNFSFIWDGKDNMSEFVPDGTYNFVMEAEDLAGNPTIEKRLVVVNNIHPFIESPKENEEVSDVVDIKGFAVDFNEFDNFTVDYAVGVDTYSAVWQPIPVPIENQAKSDPMYPNSNVSKIQVNNGTIAYWDTIGLDDGMYTIRLSVNSETGPTGIVYRKVNVNNPLYLYNLKLSNDILSPDGDGVQDITKVIYTLSEEANVSIEVEGKKVLLDSLVQSKGEHMIVWDGKNEEGNIVKDGKYVIKISALATSPSVMSEEKEEETIYVTVNTVEGEVPELKAEISSPSDAESLEGILGVFYTWKAEAEGTRYPNKEFSYEITAMGTETRFIFREINLNQFAKPGRVFGWYSAVGDDVGNPRACFDDNTSDLTIFEADGNDHPHITIEWDKPYRVRELVYNFSCSKHGDPGYFLARLCKGNKVVYEYKFDIPDTRYHTGTVTKSFTPVWADNAYFKFTGDSARNVKYWISLLAFYGELAEIIPWTSKTQSGYDTVNALEGKKLIATSNDIAPNKDTKWSCWDSSRKVTTWMEDNELYASTTESELWSENVFGMDSIFKEDDVLLSHKVKYTPPSNVVVQKWNVKLLDEKGEENKNVSIENMNSSTGEFSIKMDADALRRFVEINGVATAPELEYRLEVAKLKEPDSWTEIKKSNRQIDNGTLAVWDVTDIDEGEYIILLTVTDKKSGEIKQTYKKVTVDIPLIVTAEEPCYTNKDGSFSPDYEDVELKFNLSEEAKVNMEVIEGTTTVKTLIDNEILNMGDYTVKWDGRNSTGTIVSDGVYVCKIEAEDVDLDEYGVPLGTAVVFIPNINVKMVDKPLEDLGLSVAPDVFTPESVKSNTTISYYLSEKAGALLTISDSKEVVRTLVNNEIQEKGEQSITWNGKNEAGEFVSAGKYTCRIKATAFGDNSDVKEETKELNVQRASSGNLVVNISSPVADSIIDRTSGDAGTFFYWEAEGFGTRYPEQAFSYTINAIGEEEINAARDRPVYHNYAESEYAYPPTRLTDGALDFFAFYVEHKNLPLQWRWIEIPFKGSALITEIKFLGAELWGFYWTPLVHASRVRIDMHTLDGWKTVHSRSSGSDDLGNFFYPDPIKISPVYADGIRLWVRTGFTGDLRFTYPYTGYFRVFEIEVIGHWFGSQSGSGSVNALDTCSEKPGYKYITKFDFEAPNGDTSWSVVRTGGSSQVNLEMVGNKLYAHTWVYEPGWSTGKIESRRPNFLVFDSKKPMETPGLDLNIYNVYSKPSDVVDITSWQVKILNSDGTENTDVIVENVNKNGTFHVRLSMERQKKFLEIYGTAGGSDFKGYKLEYGQGSEPTTWEEILTSNTPVNNDLLGCWDISGRVGPYVIVLTVEDKNGKVKELKQNIQIGELIVKGEQDFASTPYEETKLYFSADTLSDVSEYDYSLTPEEDVIVNVIPITLDDANPDIVVVGPVYDFRPSGIVFNINSPVSLNCKYTKEKLIEMIGDVDVARLGVYHFKPNSEVEYIKKSFPEEVAGIVTIVADIPHFSRYILGLDESTPPAPLIDEIASPTNQSLITVSGVTEIGSTVEVFCNDKFQGKVETKPGGRFALSNVRLEEGENIITIISTNWKGIESEPANVSVTLDTLTPVLLSVNVTPSVFSPNGDKLSDTIEIKCKLSEEGNVYLSILDSDNKVLLFKEIKTGDKDVALLNWDGLDSEGEKLPDGRYNYQLLAKDLAGNMSLDSTMNYGKVCIDTTPPDILNVSSVPSVISPNEDGVQDETKISYSLMDELSSQCYVTIRIYDSNDNLIRILEDNGIKNTGVNSNIWDGKNEIGYVVNNGTYTVKIDVSDIVGNVSKQKTVLVKVDNISPLNSFSVMIDSEYFSPNGDGEKDYMSISYKLLSDANVRCLIIQPDIEDVVKTLVFDELQNEGEYSYKWNGYDDDGNVVDDGSYLCKVIATNDAGNTGGSSVFVNVDTVFPIAELSFPVDNETLNGVVEIKGKAEDENYLSYSIEYSSDTSSGIWIPISFSYDLVNDNTFVRWDTTGVSGEYTIRLTVSDKAGNVSEDKVNVNLDNPSEYLITLPPTSFNVFSPNGDGIKDSVGIVYNLKEDAKVTVGIYDSDSQLIRHLISDTTQQAGINEIEWDGKNDADNTVVDGLYSYKIEATNLSNTLTDQRVSVIEVDTVEPVVSIVSPEDNDIVGGIINITGTASDAHLEEYKVEYSKGDDPLVWINFKTSALSVNNSLLAQCDTSILDNGTYMFRIVGIDQAGNKNEVNVSVVIDNAPILAEITWPDAGEIIGKIIDITGVASCGNLECYKVEYTTGSDVDPNDSNITWESITGEINHPVDNDILATWDTEGLDGSYTLRLTVANKNKEIKYNTVPLKIDNTVPVAQIKSPENDSLVKDIVKIIGIASDDNLDKYILEYQKEEDITWQGIGSFNSSVNNEILAFWNTERLEGSYILRLKVFDKVGNFKEDIVNVSIGDNSIAIITTPKNNEVIKGTIEIKGTAKGPFFRKYDLDYGEGVEPVSLNSIVTSNTPVDNDILATWDTTLLNGEYTIRLRTFDKIGKELIEDKKVVIIDNKPLIIGDVSAIPFIFNPSYDRLNFTSINYTLSKKAKVTIEINDTHNVLVRTLIDNAPKEKGKNSNIWDGRDNLMSLLPYGEYTYKIFAVDRLGNTAVESGPVKMDVNLAPTTVIIPSKTLFNDGVNNFASLSYTYELKAIETDEVSFVEYIEINVDDNGREKYKAPISFSTEGLHTIKYRAVDNTGIWERRKVFSVIVDATSPESLLEIKDIKWEAPDSNIYIAANTKFYLETIDKGLIPSGVNLTEYRINGGEWQTYNGDFSIEGEDRDYKIEYKGIDNVGNEEDIKSVTVILDNSSAVSKLNFSKPSYIDENIWISAETLLSISSNDGAGSGVKIIEYEIDGGDYEIYIDSFSISQDGEHIISFRSTDNLNNIESVKRVTVLVDNTPANTNVFIGQPKYVKEKRVYVSSETFIAFSSEDSGAGVEKIEYSFDKGKSWDIYIDSITLSQSGNQIIQYRGIDKVNNIEVAKTTNVFVDNSPPKTELVSNPALFDNIYASLLTEFSFKAEDPIINDGNSGVNKIFYRINDSELMEYDEPFPLSAGGHMVRYYGTDNVANIEELRSFEVIVDTTSPHTDVIPSGKLYNDGTNDFAPLFYTYALKAVQGLSGVDHIEFSVDGGNWEIYSNPISFSTEGEHTIKYRAVSNTGNWEEEKEPFRVIVDGKPPEVVYLHPSDRAYIKAPLFEAIEVKFSEYVSSSSTNGWGDGLLIKEEKSGNLVSGTFVYDSKEDLLTFTSSLKHHTVYNIKLTSEIKDRVGNPLKEFSSSFTTLMLKEKGGEVREGEVWLNIPANALPQDAVIIISKEEDEIVNKIPRPLQSLEKDTLYHIVAYNQDHQEIQQKLNKPMEMKISYEGSRRLQPASGVADSGQRKGVADFSLRLDGIDIKTLKLYWYNPQKARWEKVKNSENDFSVKEVIAQVERFGQYCLMGFIPFGDSLEHLTNYPNPFPAFGRNDTTIEYYLKDDADVAIAIYDLMGNLVRTFEIRKGEEGGKGDQLNPVIWDGRNGRGDMVANGGYICRVQIDDGKRVKSKIRKILVIK